MRRVCSQQPGLGRPCLRLLTAPGSVPTRHRPHAGLQEEPRISTHPHPALRQGRPHRNLKLGGEGCGGAQDACPVQTPATRSFQHSPHWLVRAVGKRPGPEGTRTQIRLVPDLQEITASCGRQTGGHTDQTPEGSAVGGLPPHHLCPAWEPALRIPSALPIGGARGRLPPRSCFFPPLLTGGFLFLRAPPPQLFLALAPCDPRLQLNPVGCLSSSGGTSLHPPAPKRHSRQHPCLELRAAGT